MKTFKSIAANKWHFLNFGTVFLTAVKLCKLRKAHCSPPLVGEDNSMVFTSHSVPFPATRDGHWWLEMTPRERQEPFHFLHTSDGKQIPCTACKQKLYFLQSMAAIKVHIFIMPPLFNAPNRTLLLCIGIYYGTFFYNCSNRMNAMLSLGLALSVLPVFFSNSITWLLCCYTQSCFEFVYL